MFPLDAFGGHRTIHQRQITITLVAVQGLNDLVNFGGFGQIVDCAQFDRLHGRADTGVSGQHDDADIGLHINQSANHVEAGLDANTQIHDGKPGMECRCDSYGLALAVGNFNLEFPFDQGA